MGKENEILTALDELTDRVLVLTATVMKLVAAQSAGGIADGK